MKPYFLSFCIFLLTLLQVAGEVLPSSAAPSGETNSLPKKQVEQSHIDGQASPQALSTEGEAAAPGSIGTLDPELQKIIDQDNEAQAQTDQWIQEYRELNKEKTVTDLTLPMRIRDRLDSIQTAYEEYLFTHSESMEARLAYASFLADIGKDNDAARQWIKLKEKYPKNPVLWNNLGNYFGQKGQAKESFPYYEAAIALSPKEPLYIKNLASVVYIFREDAMDYYQLSEQQSLTLAQALYQKAVTLSPEDFVLATSLAQTWYYVTPFDPKRAKAAWDRALALASDDSEKQGIFLHYARVAMLSEQFDEAQKQLDAVTYSQHQVLKTNLLKNLKDRRELFEKEKNNAP